MRAGLLTETITLLLPERSSSDYRSQTIEWREGDTTRARVITAGTASLQNSEEFFAVAAVFVVRIYHRITPDMRIRWHGQEYRIIGLEPNREAMELRIKTELVNA